MTVDEQGLDLENEKTVRLGPDEAREELQKFIEETEVVVTRVCAQYDFDK